MPYTCNFCQITFETEEELQTHFDNFTAAQAIEVLNRFYNGRVPPAPVEPVDEVDFSE
jgi:hypothetical protein